MSIRLITSAPSSDAAYRTDLISRYAVANRTVQARLLAEAADYDKANPDGLPLTHDLLGASLGDVA